MTNHKKLLTCCAAFFLLQIGRTLGAEPSVPSTQPKPLEQKFPLQRIVLVDSLAEAQKPVPEGSDFVVATGSLKDFDTAELTKRLIQGKGSPIDTDLLRAVVQVITAYITQNDFPIAEIVVPDQNIRTGVLRLVVLRGKLRHIRTEGNHWFSQSLLQDRLGVAQGDLIRLSQLDQAVAWANNTNPFRQLKLHFDPVPNTGEYDLTVRVEEHVPLRFTAGYDNTGNDILGVDRYTAAVTYGNVWGREHQMTYQFTTSNHPETFKAHTVSYQVPLRWRHIFQASATYVTASPTFLEGLFTQRGETIVVDTKYVVPFKFSKWQGEIAASAGFRETNNNLEFSGEPVLGAVTDTIVGAVSAAALREDSRGKWIAALTLTGSPGTFNSRSKDRPYQENRIGANPLFGHAHLLLQRATVLTPTVVSSLRAIGQLASTNLLPSEQFSVGGMTTVRGYKERILSGDHGYIFSHELQKRFPSVSLGKHLPKLDLAGVAFWDYGRTIVKKRLRFEPKSQYLSSAGIGLRLGVANNFSASVDYAKQLEEVEIPGEPHHRVHVKVTLSY